MKLTYLGTASVLLEYGGQRLLTDPVFDPPGRTYSMGPAGIPSGWFSSSRDYESPLTVEQVGAIDAVLLSHDHHKDNLDAAGRALLNSSAVRAVITNPHGARRLARAKTGVVGLKPGESARLGDVTVTATLGQHGPRYVPQTAEVTGFAVTAPGEPSLWLSGDTVMTPGVRAALTHSAPVDVAIINAGAASFPNAPLFRSARFTFDAPEFVEACVLLNPRVIVPIHRSGWTHFQPESQLHQALENAGLLNRVRWLELGESTEVQAEIDGG